MTRRITLSGCIGAMFALFTWVVVISYITALAAVWGE